MHKNDNIAENKNNKTYDNFRESFAEISFSIANISSLTNEAIGSIFLIMFNDYIYGSIEYSIDELTHKILMTRATNPPDWCINNLIESGLLIRAGNNQKYKLRYDKIIPTPEDRLGGYWLKTPIEKRKANPNE